MKGLLLVVSGPSGVGKGTICEGLVKRDKNIKMSVSATTRHRRNDEIEAVDYFFMSKEQFEQMIEQNEFLEYMTLFNSNYYGTPKAYVEEELEAGNDIILEIDYHGALNVKKLYPQAVLIFIAPPAFADLRNRLIHRNADDERSIAERLATAQEEINMMEKYDYIIVNDIVDKAVGTVQAIICAEKNRVIRKPEFIQMLRQEVTR